MIIKKIKGIEIETFEKRNIIMGIISLASGSSCWRGLVYYKNKKVIKLNKTNEDEYESVVKETSNYNAYFR